MLQYIMYFLLKMWAFVLTPPSRRDHWTDRDTWWL